MTYIHPARQVDYDTLADAISMEIVNGNIRVQHDTDSPLAIYNYTEQCAFDKKWTPWSIMARGLILDTVARRVVATPFPKFWNYGEGTVVLPDEPFRVTTKMDGSLGIVFFHDGRWRVATRGSFKSEQAQWAQAWLDNHVDRDVLIEGSTYLVEIVYASNRIVVNYNFEGLVMLAAYSESGIEINRQTLELFSILAGIQPVEAVVGHSLDDLLAIAKTLSCDEEGFVVRFAGGLRIKIKGDEYCRVHKLVSRVTPLAVYEMIEAFNDPDVIMKQLPEEFLKDFNAIYTILLKRIEAQFDAIEIATAFTEDMDDKTLGLWLKTQTQITPDIAKWIFTMRKQPGKFYTPGLTRSRVLAQIRPTANQLPGYVPSSAMNRFVTEDA